MEAAPSGVRQGILAIWITLGISSLSALIAKIAGMSSQGDFVGAIIVYALLCIVPYKLSNRSNSARYVYAVITATSLLFMAAGIGAMNKVDLAVSIALVPVEIFIIFRLFQADASAWFTAPMPSQHGDFTNGK